MRLAQLIGPELETLLRENPEEVRDLLDEIHPEDFADLLGELDQQRASELLTQLPTDYAAQVFERLDDTQQEEFVAKMGLDSTARIAVEMDADERADLIGTLPPDIVQPLLDEIEKVDPEAKEDVEELSRWLDTSAGGLMTTDYVSVRPNLLISDAIQEIRRRADDAESVDTLFVVDPHDKLVGLLTLRDMVIAEASAPIHDVMHHNIISVPPELDQEEVAKKFAKYDLHLLPVVDEKGAMLGVITSDDILDVIEEEQDEDVQKMGAMEPLEERYLSVSFTMFLRKRAPWLTVLFIGGFFTTSAMKHFNKLLAELAVLSFYLPLLIAAGGNSGSQSSTLIIRSLAVGDIRTADWWRVLLRELLQGLVLGLMLASFGVARVFVAGDGAELALLIAITIIAIVVMGCVVGGMMPLLLHRVGIDPATSSTPFIATLVDVLGIVIYLSLARWILAGILPQAAG